MKPRKKRFMAYVSMPFLFALCGYGLLYLLLSPMVPMIEAVSNMMFVNSSPQKHGELSSIYNQLQVPEQISIDQVQFPDQGMHFAQLSCDRIGLSAPVFWGDSKEILKEGVGQYIGSFLPGFQKPILLSGHNATYLKPLQSIELGDVLIYQTNYGEYHYEVSRVDIIHSEDAKELQKEWLNLDQEILVMYTCYPFELLMGTKKERLFVFADKISGLSIE